MMNARIFGLIALFMVGSTGAFAEAPEGYYPVPNGHDKETFRAMLAASIDDGDYLPYSSTAYDTHDAVDELDEVLGNEALVNLIYSDAVAEKEDWPAYNREHVWPQSLGAGPGSPAHVDMHHIFSCDANVNSARGNQQFGECVEDCGSHPEAPEAKYNGVFFEPPAEQKGDVARALLYMDLRYEGRNGEPDLVLLNGEVETGCDCMGSLDTLLLWHEEDPVDAREQLRNDEVYAIQGNRNPFVDHPEWVGLIHGVEESVGTTEEETFDPSVEPVVVEPETDEEEPQAAVKTVYMRPMKWSDGHVVERAAGTGKGGFTRNRDEYMLVGDTNENLEMIGVLSFDLATLPEGAVVTKAIVHVTQVANASEAGIHDRLGALRVELARRFLGSSPALGTDDLSDESAVYEVASTTTEVGVGETIGFELSQQAFRYLKSNMLAQFRLRFDSPSNEDWKRDAIGLGAGNHSNMLMRPLLELEYTVPEAK